MILNTHLYFHSKPNTRKLVKLKYVTWKTKANTNNHFFKHYLVHVKCISLTGGK